ncbi:MAG: hypothetical protein QOH45_1774, partial [Pseudonocardiales bacterium]|nr:hypothetical protein [Pseudonocardiales bacterium]
MARPAPRHSGQPNEPRIILGELLGRPTQPTAAGTAYAPAKRTAIPLKAMTRREVRALRPVDPALVFCPAVGAAVRSPFPHRKLANSAGAIVAVSSLAAGAALFGPALAGPAVSGAPDSAYPERSILGFPGLRLPGGLAEALNADGSIGGQLAVPMAFAPTSFDAPTGAVGAVGGQVPAALAGRGATGALPGVP